VKKYFVIRFSAGQVYSQSGFCEIWQREALPGVVSANYANNPNLFVFKKHCLDVVLKETATQSRLQTLLWV